jgi:hypothetical protein
VEDGVDHAYGSSVNSSFLESAILQLGDFAIENCLKVDGEIVFQSQNG